MGFSVIPANLRIPAVLTEVDNSQANGGGALQLRTLLIGEKLSTGSAPADVPVFVSDPDGLFGRGSILAVMCAAWRRNNPLGELWALPVSDSAGTAAAGTVVFSGTATAAGVFTIYVAGKRVRFACPSGYTATQQGAAFVAALAALPDLPVTGVNTTGSVAVTARNKGPLGNFIDLRVNYGGTKAGEALPAGTSVTITPMSSGATPPDLTDAIDSLADSLFDFIGVPWAGVAGAGDDTTLDGVQELMDSASGRWSALREVYGHVYGIKHDTSANLLALGADRNDPHMTLFGGAGIGMPNAPWEVLAMAIGRISASISVHPAQPTQTLELIGCLPPAEVDTFDKSTRQSLLNSGIATLTVTGGKVVIERDISTYQTNGAGTPDTSWLDSNTAHQLAYYLRYRKAKLVSQFGRSILVNSSKGVRPGIPIATPALIAAAERSIYADMVEVAIMENQAAFDEALSVTRDVDDPNRVNSIIPPDLANQLRVLAGLAQFRLQFPSVA